jgi:hypothetical protein
MPKSSILAIIIALVIAGAGIYYFDLVGLSEMPAAVKTGTPEDGYLAGVDLGNKDAQTSGDPAKQTGNNVPASLTDGKTYTSDEYGFSFRYPAGFKVSSFDERGGHMVLVKRAYLEARGIAK